MPRYEIKCPECKATSRIDSYRNDQGQEVVQLSCSECGWSKGEFPAPKDSEFPKLRTCRNMGE